MPPPFFCALKAAAGLLRSGAGAAALILALAAAFPTSSAAGTSPGSVPAAGTLRPPAPRAGIAINPSSRPALPGLAVSGPAGAEAAGEQGGEGGPANGFRGRAPMQGPATVLTAAAARVRNIERSRLGHSTTQRDAQTGHASFHCDTPPPRRV